MSGRDFKLFLASHQSQIGQQDSRLVMRLLSGHKPLYKPVDYTQLSVLTKIKQSQGDRALKKVKKLTQLNKSSKEQSLLCEHKRIWENEMHKLQQMENKLQTDLASLRPKTPNFELSTTSIEEMYEDIIDYEEHLHHETYLFKKNTLQPVLDLKEDIDVWIKANQDQISIGKRNIENENNVKETLDSVKTQHKLVLQQLDDERHVLDEDLHAFVDFIGFNVVDMKLPKIKIGIPHEVLMLECPDESLKDSCLHQFDNQNEKYISCIENLEEKYQDVIDRAPFGGWNQKDYFHFVHVVGQYSDVSTNRRKLYMDRLKRELPHKTKSQLLNYEDWWFRHKLFQTQLKDLFHAWKRDQNDLVLHVTSIIEQACVEYEMNHKSMIDHVKQKFVCNFLHEKLREYQIEKLELMKLETAQIAIQQEELKSRKKKDMSEKEKRVQNKKKILEHKKEQEIHVAEERERDKIRMLELQEKQALQRAYDQERVRYRQGQYQWKLEKRHSEQLRVENEHLEKERRLKALKDQVAVNVEEDTSRVFKPTEAYKYRIAADYDEELGAQEPLFNVYTYTVDQVAQDKRLKVENALRRADLHMTDYAKNILKSIAPPSKPRKDMESTAFK